MRSSRLVWLLGFSAWLALLVGGWYALLRHEFTPGLNGRVPEMWPADSALNRDGERPTLVLFAHRSCPCTRATLTELEHLLTDAQGRVRPCVVLLAPPASTADRVGGDIETQARSLPDARVVVDVDGEEARRFHVRTSGHVVLYGVDGRLMFSGGITDARGHAGDSIGRQAVLAWLGDGVGERKTASVYGCCLFAESDEAATEDESWDR